MGARNGGLPPGGELVVQLTQLPLEELLIASLLLLQGLALLLYKGRPVPGIPLLELLVCLYLLPSLLAQGADGGRKLPPQGGRPLDGHNLTADGALDPHLQSSADGLLSLHFPAQRRQGRLPLGQELGIPAF